MTSKLVLDWSSLANVLGVVCWSFIKFRPMIMDAGLLEQETHCCTQDGWRLKILNKFGGIIISQENIGSDGKIQGFAIVDFGWRRSFNFNTETETTLKHTGCVNWIFCLRTYISESQPRLHVGFKLTLNFSRNLKLVKFRALNWISVPKSIQISDAVLRATPWVLTGCQ